MTDTTGIFNIEALHKKDIVFLVKNKDDALAIIASRGISVGTGDIDNFLRYIEENRPQAHTIVISSCNEDWEQTGDYLHNGLKHLDIPHSTVNLISQFRSINEYYLSDPDSLFEHINNCRGFCDSEIDSDAPLDEELDHLVSIDDLEYREADFLVEGLLERDSLVGVFGESGAGKSFFVIDLLSSISAGINFHGRPVQQAPTIYICGEGRKGIIKRNRAWNLGRWKNPNGKKNFYPVTMEVSLPDERMEERLIDLINSTINEYDISTPGVIALDTVARTLSGDENSNADVSAYIRCLDRIKQRYPGATILIVHHTGHSEKERARGASALKCALDTEIRVQINADPGTGQKVMTVSNSKAKDAEEFPDLFFSMTPVEVFTKSSGEAETSCYLEEITADQTSKLKNKLPARASTALDAFKEALQETIKAKIEADDLKNIHEGVQLDEWRTSFYRRSTAETPEGKRKAFERARSDLVKMKLMEVDTDMYKLTGEEHNKAVSAYFLAYKRESPGHMDRTGH